VDHLEQHTHTVEGNAVMPTMEDYAKQPREQRLQRLARTADDLAAAVKGQSDAVLSRRPDARNWAAKEIVCHLRASIPSEAGSRWTASCRSWPGTTTTI
jgi:hypothetical protein